LSTLPVSLSRNLLHNIESALSSAATDIKGGQDQIRCESLIAKLPANRSPPLGLRHSAADTVESGTNIWNCTNEHS
jgi:hypothetical protein